MSTYTYAVGGVPLYTRTLTAPDRSRTVWHLSGRVTHERAERFGTTHDGEPTYVWVTDGGAP